MSGTEIHHAIRGIVSRAVVHSTNDNGETQTATITMFRHVDRSDVEILHPFGLSSRPPSGKTGVMVVFAVGGDQGDLVGLPVGAPAFRLGNLDEGDVAIHTMDGSRFHVKADGTLLAWSSKRVHVKVEDAEIEVDKDMIRARMGPEKPRVVIKDTYAKLRSRDHWLVVDQGGITCSVPPVVGPDPDPSA